MTTKTYAQLGAFASIDGPFLIAGWDPAGPGPLKTAQASVYRTYFQANLGTASLKDTGTSGNKVALLDGANTWSAAQVFGNAASVTGDFPVSGKVFAAGGEMRFGSVSSTLRVMNFSVIANIGWQCNTDSGVVTLYYNNVAVFSIDSAGNVIAKGTITPSGTPGT